MGIIVIAIGLLCFCIIVMTVCLSIQDNTNKKLQFRIASLTSENIELKNKLEYCKQRIKTLNGHYYISDKNLDLHTMKSGYPSKLVDEHFDELI